MEAPLFTLIYGFRDREPERVRRCLDSLSNQTFTGFEVIFVDYGSSAANRAQVQPLVERYPFCQYIYTEARGHPWNRSKALNIGIRQARTPYIATTDIDLIYMPDFCAALAGNFEENRLLQCTCFYLPEKFGDWDNLASYAGCLPASSQEHTFGLLQGMPRALIHELQGFDEYYRYYGREDDDLRARLVASGLTIHWINDQTSIFHQWHPITSNIRDMGDLPGSDERDLVVRWDALLYDQRQRGALVRNGEDWGRVLQADDRPVFMFVDPDQGTLRQNTHLSTFDMSYYPLYAARRLLEAFWDLPSGHALVVHQADQPRRSHRADQVITWVNRYILKRLDTAVDYRMNRLHAFIAYFILQEEHGLIADYYLDLNGISVLVKT